MEAGFSLAADRSTKTLPVAFAEVVFIGGWLLALLRAASSEPNPANWVNVEAHSVAFSALYLWVTTALVIGSVIGASQSEDSIPRHLQGFEYDRSVLLGENAERLSTDERKQREWCERGVARAMNGGLYSCRPTKWTPDAAGTSIRTGTLIVLAIIATAVIGIGCLTAGVLSYLIPPRGPSCRHIPESMMWVLLFIGLWTY